MYNIQDKKDSIMIKQKGQVLIIEIIIGVLITGGFFVAYYFGALKNSKPEITKSVSNSENPQATTTTVPTQTPDETANWKTYTDQKYKYSLKYPDSWILQQTPSGGISVNSPDFNDNFKKGATLVVWPNSQPPLTSNDFRVDSQQKISLNNLDATSYQVSGAGIDGKADSVYIKRDNSSILIDFRYEQVRKQELEKVFNQVLSTFKFTN